MIDLSQKCEIDYDGPCIYCGKTGLDLKREHVMPEGLGGNFVLLSSSCSECEAATSRFERFMSQRMWGVLRKRAGIKGKKKRRKVEFPYVLLKNGGAWSKVSIEPEKFPLAVMFPELNGPRIIEKTRSERTDVLKFQFNPLFDQKEFPFIPLTHV